MISCIFISSVYPLRGYFLVSLEELCHQNTQDESPAKFRTIFWAGRMMESHTAVQTDVDVEIVF